VTPPDATSDVLGDVDDLDEEDRERAPAGADAGVVAAPDDLTDQPTAEPQRDAEPARA
jgi:hypothetical protein